MGMLMPIRRSEFAEMMSGAGLAFMWGSAVVVWSELSLVQTRAMAVRPVDDRRIVGWRSLLLCATWRPMARSARGPSGLGPSSYFCADGSPGLDCSGRSDSGACAEG